ncbi:FRG domain-containing protein [Thermomonas sp. HDW16]|uniref:FRG domain-containing protein n=1 Tax=Thermomonas sp. HDW16 TaxID=2714945 RepID=UPI00140C7179|nr:FRG domain-containing protein [Thermomonas sp. HDW16]QIL20206.1 FRG domain-containing protein [Thermomonas sp. HDW16]
MAIGESMGNGEAINSVQHFDSIEDVLVVLQREVVADEMRNLFRLDGIEYLWTSDGTMIPSITSDFVSPYLYRGQTARHRPCLPSVFRGLSAVDHPQKLTPAERARCFVDRVKLEEFTLALEMHPASRYAREIGLRVHPYALAQHYELPTDRIDLTQDHAVAAFFATNSCKNGVWLPERDGIGIVYRLHRNSFSEHYPDNLVCIGKQALPRPGEQKAYAFTLPLGFDFERFPMDIYTFQQVESCGQRLNDHFKGGDSLFPPDVMAEVANTIKAATTLSRQVVTRILGLDKSPPLPATKALEMNETFLRMHSSVHVSDREPIAMNSSQRKRAQASVKRMRRTFLKGVGALAVRKVKPGEFAR